MSLEDELTHHTDRGKLFAHRSGLCYTDSVKHLATVARAYWLIDVTAAYQSELSSEPRQFWELEVHSDRTATLSLNIGSGDESSRVRQAIGFTDFPLKRFSFYVVHGVMTLEPKPYTVDGNC